jgi:hypothetical protein
MTNLLRKPAGPRSRLLFPTDEVLQQMEDTLDQRTGLGRVAMRTMVAELNARIAQLQAGG